MVLGVVAVLARRSELAPVVAVVGPAEEPVLLVDIAGALVAGLGGRLVGALAERILAA